MSEEAVYTPIPFHAKSGVSSDKDVTLINRAFKNWGVKADKAAKQLNSFINLFM